MSNKQKSLQENFVKMICKVLLLLLVSMVWLGLVNAQFRPEGSRPQRPPLRPQGPPVRPSQSRRYVCLLFLCLHLIEKNVLLLKLLRHQATILCHLSYLQHLRKKRFMLNEMLSNLPGMFFEYKNISSFLLHKPLVSKECYNISRYVFSPGCENDTRKLVFKLL